MKDNENLVKKSKDIQNQAQSGDLLNSKAKSNEPKIVYTLPPGANALADLESSDPATYQEYKTNYAPFFGINFVLITALVTDSPGCVANFSIGCAPIGGV